MAVKYKYRDESEIIISDANDYSIEVLEDEEQTFYQPIGIATKSDTEEQYYWTLFLDVFLLSPSMSSLFISEERDIFTKQHHWKTTVNNPYQFKRINSTYITVIDSVPFAATADIEIGIVSTPGVLWKVEDVSSFPDDLFSGSREGVPVLWGRRFRKGEGISREAKWTLSGPTYWHSFTLFKDKYKLNIILDDLIIYSRTELYRPEYVQRIGRECNPDTCPVLCGDMVCCYGSDGIATESSNLSESIY